MLIVNSLDYDVSRFSLGQYRHLQTSLGEHLAPQLRRALVAVGADIRTMQELLGRSDVSTTMTFIHVLKVAATGTDSPLDSLALHFRPS